MDGTFLFIFDGVCICNPHGGTLLVVSSKFKDFTHQGSRSGWGMQTQGPADRRSGHCVATVTLLTDRPYYRRHLDWLANCCSDIPRFWVRIWRLDIVPEVFHRFPKFLHSKEYAATEPKQKSRLISFAAHRNHCHSFPISRYTRIKISI